MRVIELMERMHDEEALEKGLSGKKAMRVPDQTD